MNTVYFEKGMNIASVYGFYQWDYGQTIEIKGVETNGNVCVQFSMDQLGGNAVPVVTEVKEGSIIAKIPSFVFEKETTQNYNAYAFIYVTDADSGETVKTIKLNIKARPKPEDYIYTEPEKQKYEILENLIKSFLNKNGEIDPKKIPDMYYKEDGLVNTIKEEYLGLDWIPKIRENNIEIFKEQHITVEENNNVGNNLYLHDLNINQETREKIIDKYDSLTLVLDGRKIELSYVKRFEEDGIVNAAVFTIVPYDVVAKATEGTIMVGRGKYASMQVALTPGEHTLEVRYIKSIPNPMPYELLPDGTPYLLKSYSEILPEMTGTTSEQYNNGIPLPIGLELLDNEEYTVKWNGDEYKCVCYAEELEDVKNLILGDVYTISGGEVGKEATGEPFVFIVYPKEYQEILGFSGMCSPIPNVENETFTFSITGYEKKFRKLPEECLPDSIKDLLNGELPSINVDKELSEESENPVQNKAVAAAVNKLSEEIVDLKSVLSGGSKNVFDPLENTVDTAYNQAFILSSGAIRNNGSGSDEGYFVTGKLSIEPNTKYTIKPNIWIEAVPSINRGRCYSSNDTALTALEWVQDDDGYYTFVSPENTAYVRFSVHKETIGINNGANFEDIIALFNSVFSLNVDGGYGDVTVENAVLYTEQNLTDEQKKQARDNIGSAPMSLFKIHSGDKVNELTRIMTDKSAFTEGKYCSYTSGNIINNANYCCTEDYIAFPEMAKMVVHYSGSTTKSTYPIVAYYDENKTFIGGEEPATLVQKDYEGKLYAFYNVPNATRFIRLSVTKDNLTNRFETVFLYIVTEKTESASGVEIPDLIIPELVELLTKTDGTKYENIDDAVWSKTRQLKGKTIVNFGDSVFGNARPPQDVSTFLANLTGATVHNCAFGGCRMAQHVGHWDAFSMYRLADAVATGDYSLQDDALNYDDRTSYAEVPLTLLKSIDFNTVDIVTIAYGTNDWSGTNRLDKNDDLYDTEYFGGALRYSIERLLGAYPNLKIFVLCPTYRFWMNENGEFVEDSDTKLSNARTLLEYVELSRTIAKNYHIPFIDNYYELGINKFNRSHYFPSTDGTHHDKEGRVLLAEHIASKLF